MGLKRRQWGGPRTDAGPPPSGMLVAVAVYRRLAKRLTGETPKLVESIRAFQDAHRRASGAISLGPEFPSELAQRRDALIVELSAAEEDLDTGELAKLADEFEAHATNVERSAYRNVTVLDSVIEDRPGGRFAPSRLVHRPPPPCRCKAYGHPHQHCAIRGCEAIAEADAVDPWFVEDIMWGMPAPKAWHCEKHREVERRCVALAGDLPCSNTVRTHIAKRLVLCERCQQRADILGGADPERESHETRS